MTESLRTDFLKFAAGGKPKLVSRMKPLGLIPKRAGVPTTDSRGEAYSSLPLFVLAPAAGRVVSELDYAKAIGLLAQAGFSQTEIARLLNKQETWISFINKLNGMSRSLLGYLPNTVKPTALIKGVDAFGATATESALHALSRLHPGMKVSERQLRETAATFLR